MVVMTFRRLNIQYGIDIDSLSTSGKKFSMNLLKNLLNRDSLWECLVEACSCNDTMKNALDAAKSLISPLRSLSIRIKCYYNQNNYNIDVRLSPRTTILFKDSGVVFYEGNFYYGETSNPSELIGWIKHRNIV